MLVVKIHGGVNGLYVLIRTNHTIYPWIGLLLSYALVHHIIIGSAYFMIGLRISGCKVAHESYLLFLKWF